MSASSHVGCTDAAGVWLPCDRRDPGCLTAVRARLAAKRAAYLTAFRPSPCSRGCGRLTDYGTGDRCGRCIHDEARASLALLMRAHPEVFMCRMCDASLVACQCHGAADDD